MGFSYSGCLGVVVLSPLLGNSGGNDFTGQREADQGGFTVLQKPEAVTAVHDFFYLDLRRIIAVHDQIRL
jgi:hypothetical protein